MNLTDEESQFILWSFAKAPLFINHDLSNMTADQVAIVNNTKIIEINQDPLGLQAECMANCTNTDAVHIYQSF